MLQCDTRIGQTHKERLNDTLFISTNQPGVPSGRVGGIDQSRTTISLYSPSSETDYWPKHPTRLDTTRGPLVDIDFMHFEVKMPQTATLGRIEHP